MKKERPTNAIVDEPDLE